LKENTSRKHEVHLRLNDEEHQALERNSIKCKLTKQVYLRKMCLDVKPKEWPPMELFRMINELQKITNDMYFIARASSTQHWLDEDLYWDNVEKLKRVLKDLFDQIFD